MSTQHNLYIKNRVYELLDGWDKSDIFFDIDLIELVINLDDNIKLLRMMLNVVDRASFANYSSYYVDYANFTDFALYFANAMNYEIRSEMVKWSLAYGANPNFVHTKKPIRMVPNTCIEYYIVGPTTMDITRLMLDTSADVNRKVCLATLYFALENLIDAEDVEYTCVIAMLVEANF